MLVRAAHHPESQGLTMPRHTPSDLLHLVEQAFDEMTADVQRDEDGKTVVLCRVSDPRDLLAWLSFCVGCSTGALYGDPALYRTRGQWAGRNLYRLAHHFFPAVRDLILNHEAELTELFRAHNGSPSLDLEKIPQ